MKFIYIMLLIMSITFPCIGQKYTAAEKKIIENEAKELLSDEAFNKMIIQDITYAIFGESTPVSGIKIDISKPEATISGVFKPKKDLFNKYTVIYGLEFKGGVTDKNFVIYKGIDKFNTAFELRPSIHIIPSFSSAKYYYSEIPITKAKNKIIENDISQQMDTFYVSALLYNRHLSNIKDITYLKDVDIIKIFDTTPSLPNEFNIGEKQKALMLQLIKKSNIVVPS